MNIWINQMSWGQKWVFSDISCWGQLGLHFCQHRLPANCQQGEAATPVAKLETHTLLSAAIGTVADVATFCARQPQTCEAMASVASVAEAKAKYSLKLAYEWANGQPIAAPVGDNGQSNGISGLLKQPDLQDRHAPQPSAELGASPADPLVTGSTSRMAETRTDTGTNTLRIDDLIPDWRGPEPSRPS
jgi:hypothetical protein